MGRMVTPLLIAHTAEAARTINENEKYEQVQTRGMERLEVGASLGPERSAMA